MVKKESAKKPAAKQKPGSAPKKTVGSAFPVIGIGASAGGLEALKTFFSAVSEKSSFAYIVVVHMMSGQPSLMAELLQKTTPIKVLTAAQNLRIKPGHVYINPPDKIVRIKSGKIQLSQQKRDQHLFPINLFFKSLARDQSQTAAGIVLSGTGTDGSLGLQEIKANGGLVLVQSEASAKYDGMPKSAIQTGVADLVLPPELMPEKLYHYFLPRNTGADTESDSILQADQKWLDQIFAILRIRIGHDFSKYKTNTLMRRIKRRLDLNSIGTMSDYLILLRESPEEIDALFRELLIGVTSFFRDPQSFEKIRETILTKVFPKIKDEYTFRAWIPGCSTGEEVYSLAMLLTECLDKIHIRINLQLFGTDIDRYAIDKARAAVYPSAIKEDISPERLNRFFIKEGQGYRIRKEIRDCAIFSIQDVTKDAPFSRLDLVCCRNLLIYLNSEAQKKILPLFHYTLVPEGILVLGSSETIGYFSSLFSTIDTKWKIYQRREISFPSQQQVHFPSGLTHHETMVFKEPKTFRIEKKMDEIQLVQKIILEQMSSTVLVIDRTGNLIHVQGKTGKYFEVPNGPPSSNILDLAKDGLRIELSMALREAASSSSEVVLEKDIQIKINEDYQPVHLKVSKIQRPEELAGRLMVILEDVYVQPDKKRTKSDSGDRIPDEVKTMLSGLEKELQYTRESHQITIEELESSNEELKSTNEELQSSNEELQSSNEELESSKEELQSLNEELQTVNSESQSKLDELAEAHDDMRNLMNSTQIASIFVDNNGMVKRFTQEAAVIINLIPTDIGRPLKHVVSNLVYEDMIKDIETVIRDLLPKEMEVVTKNGQWFNMRIMPYRTTDNRINGAVVTFANIDEQKTAIAQMKKAWQLSRNLFDMNKNPLVVIDDQAMIVIANTAFTSLMNESPQNISGRSLTELKENSLSSVDLKKMIKTVLKTKKSFVLKNKEKGFSIQAQTTGTDLRSPLILMEYIHI